ncbi:alpha-ketoglutarate-dependent dioxygenase AlkB [Oceanospirillaceae bacterium]|jgi:alkylated DNA repair dioxygenase AlkB|uniref:alpha-ketoglutarate-dependent dioxygenase AlkB family protein n=1 Tax=Candidatus Njordibacter sp. Uisw_002 TaxID=3230971 RepID=UPI002A44CA04|nr:alpha-ketoglutarate-dependent dioxygenase AlkB [Oceanospirillaceae bacterium]|tara:strand:- start:333 stop:944 length:612 start_codon:yes stop_codon:yes gene_type:complete
MSLFSQRIDPPINVLPQDGEANYHGVVLEDNAADFFLEHFLNAIEWRNDEAIVFDKKIITKRKVAWYGSRPFDYTYSKITRSALPWTSQLLELKQLIETITSETFNSCLLNLYHTGDEGMAWHSDNERQLKRHGAIASVSLGAQRNFAFKHKHTQQTHTTLLQHGSLLVMQGTTQDHWLHRLPPSKKVHTPRVNLTFRTVVER